LSAATRATTGRREGGSARCASSAITARVFADACLAIGSVALIADSLDFLEDAAINLLIFAGLGWSARNPRGRRPDGGRAARPAAHHRRSRRASSPTPARLSRPVRLARPAPATASHDPGAESTRTKAQDP
jgi:hypothetical protein